MRLTDSPSRILPSKLLQTPGGDGGVRVTLAHMQKFVQDGKRDARVRQQALMLTRNLLQKDWRGEIKALFNYVKYEIRYIKDIRGVETLQTPAATMEL